MSDGDDELKVWTVLMTSGALTVECDKIERTELEYQFFAGGECVARFAVDKVIGTLRAKDTRVRGRADPDSRL